MKRNDIGVDLHSRDAESRVLNTLGEASVHYNTGVSLKEFSYQKTGGFAAIVLKPQSIEELAFVVGRLNANSVPFKIVGETTNIMFLDDSVYGCLISTRGLSLIEYVVESDMIVAECGAMLPDLSRKALHLSQTGFEGLEGIPGTVGGAVFMNAGAYGNDVKSTLVEVDLIRPDGSLVKLLADEIKLTLRSSALRRGELDGAIAKCYFKGAKGNIDSIYSRMELYHAKRHKYQEFMYPNLGSLFSGSFYRVLAKKDFIFNIVMSTHYFFNYKLKLFRRESPMNRRWINNFAVKRFGISY